MRCGRYFKPGEVKKSLSFQEILGYSGWRCRGGLFKYPSGIVSKRPVFKFSLHTINILQTGVKPLVFKVFSAIPLYPYEPQYFFNPTMKCFQRNKGVRLCI